MKEEVIPVDKKYVRKIDDKNVSISNIRRSLPREINAEIFEAAMQTSKDISESEKDFLLNYYKKRSRKTGEVYILRTIPVRIPIQGMKAFFEVLSIDDDKKNFLGKYYELSKTEGKFILKEEAPIDEEDEIQILKILKLNGLHVSNAQKAKISEILEKITDPRFEEIKENTFYANLFIHPDHDYFIDPYVKHTSGYHLGEAARQFPIACTHLFGKLPLDGITFTLKSLYMDFVQYVSLNKSVLYKATMEDLKLKNGAWNAWTANIEVFQDTNLVAKMKMSCQILPLSTYKLVREDRNEYDMLPRFRPLEKYAKNISIRNNGKKILCSIADLSTKGFGLRFVGSPPDISKSKEFEFFMHFDGTGFIHGMCELLWSKLDPENEDQYIAGFKITEISDLDMENLKESINRFSYLMEDRELRSPIKTLKYVFLHFDGAVMQNILTPIFYNMVQRFGGKYSAEAENYFFSKPRDPVLKFLIDHYKLKMTPDDVLAVYYDERAKYLINNKVEPLPYLEEFLDILKSLGLKIISYGGAPKEYFDENIKQFESYFDGDKYFRTYDIRPGLREIIDAYGIEDNEALFIDETVGPIEIANKYDIPFIGIPTKFDYSFQREEMQKAGAKYIVGSLKEINLTLLKQIDNENPNKVAE